MPYYDVPTSTRVNGGKWKTKTLKRVFAKTPALAKRKAEKIAASLMRKASAVKAGRHPLGIGTSDTRKIAGFKLFR